MNSPKTHPEKLPRGAEILDPGELSSFVESFLNRRELFLKAVEDFGAPLFFIEDDILRNRAQAFRKAFSRFLPDIRIYYALKSNNHPEVARILVESGLGLDVSSGRELEIALETNCSEIIFSGPGKTPGELSRAGAYRDRVTLLIDSFGELERLGQLTGGYPEPIRCGVRLTVPGEGRLWTKFGIPPERLEEFIDAARLQPGIQFQGIQFHTSWNLDPSAQVSFLSLLAAVLKKLPTDKAAHINFIDIGGGFWPEEGEWLLPDNFPEKGMSKDIREPMIHYRRPARAIEEFAAEIEKIFREKIFPFQKVQVRMEPGRWICHPALQILLRVIDLKSPDLAITDAGTNAVGWERYEREYFPVINLSRPSGKDHRCLIVGSLCTPHDIWGFSYHGNGIWEGDILLIPNQGAYTYSLRQDFIKPLPPAVINTRSEIRIYYPRIKS